MTKTERASTMVAGLEVRMPANHDLRRFILRLWARRWNFILDRVVKN
jgi:hypothetical protein